MHKYVIVHFIHKPSQLEFPASNWPLHITLLGNHNTPTLEYKLVKSLDSFVKTCSAFEVLVEDEAMFGIQKDILVSKLKINKEILNLHKGLKDVLDINGANYDNPSFIGQGYQPHSTVQKDSRLNANQTVLINSFSLVDIAPDGNTSKRKVIKTFYFEK